MLERHAELLENRVRKNFRHFGKRFAKQNIEAYRLYDWDIPEVRARVDYYAGQLVVAEYEREQTRGVEGYLEALGAAAARGAGVSDAAVHLKVRRTRPNEGARYEKLSDQGERLIVREGELRYWVNLDDFVDTGLFADHRKTRAWLAQQARGKSFLNLYCYTGAFTCAVAQAGAASTTSVDLSARYLEWTADNLALNQLDGPQHERVQADVRLFLEESAAKRRRWDLIFVDPPSFSTVGSFAASAGAPTENRSSSRPGAGLDIQSDHSALVRAALSCLAPSGTLVFSTNHQRFVPAFDSGCAVEEITHRTVPEDFRNRQAHRCFLIGAP